MKRTKVTVASATKPILPKREGDLPYFIEVDANGCSKCGAGRSWTVCGPDDVWLSTSYEGPEGEEQAEWLADILNAAYFAGKGKP